VAFDTKEVRNPAETPEVVGAYPLLGPAMSTPFAADLNGPFGGVKQSGLGRELALPGLTAYTETHTVSTRHL
jgi:acyl-CoA reductase-like NAD-dependent aldehyde dehydrogenase